MNNKLKWYIDCKTIFLQGELGRNTLLPLWRSHKDLFNNIEILNISSLYKIDSTGMALILYILNYSYKLKNLLILTGITKQFITLVDLYQLQNIISNLSIFIN